MATLEAGIRRIRVGVGGWTYEPWRGRFFPPGLAHDRELAYASRRLTTIEINGTYYRLQKPESFAKWRAEAPDDFVFTVKASRYCTTQKVLANVGEAMQKFLASGLFELGEKLGPVVWQFMATKRFDEDDFGAFLALLPRDLRGLPLRHAVEVRHESFRSPAFLALARRHGVAAVFADTDEYPSFADVTADFVYGRLMRTRPEIETGYGADALDRWADAARAWARGREPEGLPRIEPAQAAGKSRDVFLFVISGAKERAPAAAEGLIARLDPARVA
jgi:uncharacterized protein YecE (DUF72 family)